MASLIFLLTSTDSLSRILTPSQSIFLLVSEEEDKAKEVQHIQNALLANGYKRWPFKVPSRPSPTSQENSTSETTRPISVGLRYVSGLSEHLSRDFRAQDIRTYHKPYNTLRTILVYPKDRTPTEKKTGVVYDITCNDCGEHYIGETARTLEKRLGEHQKQTTSAIREHQSQAITRSTGKESRFLIKSP